MDNKSRAQGYQISECLYCGKTTTASILDTAGIRLPLCKTCRRVDPTPPAHDPTLEPGWRTVRVGTRGPNPWAAMGVSVPAVAQAWGVTRQAAHKRLAKAFRVGGVGAVVKLLTTTGPGVLRPGPSQELVAAEMAARDLSLADLETLVDRLQRRARTLRRGVAKTPR